MACSRPPGRRASSLPPPPGRSPQALLGPEAAEIYLAMLRRLLQAGRLNRFFPDPGRLDNLLSFLAPSGGVGAYPGLEVNLRTGMPAEPAVGRILSQQDLSDKFLAEVDLPGLSARTDLSPAERRLLEQARFHQRLQQASLPRWQRLDLALRRVETEKRWAFFTTVFDRFDASEELFVRYTVQLYQHHGRWTRPLVDLQGDDLEATGPFRTVISRYHSDEAEFAFVLLSELSAITVEEVVRCRVGPLWFEGVEMLPEVAELLAAYPGNFILHLPTDRAGLTVREDGNRDPFSVLWRQVLHPGARDVAEKKARDLGYHVYKERKFACTRAVAGPFSDWLKSRGTRCVVYPV
ncbi:MAG: hypothetical protein ACOX9B_00500 [Candidatus Xenobium sp.]|jgi:hypothetical protein|nr:hypothetical protein [Burkholderiales bacterium]